MGIFDSVAGAVLGKVLGGGKGAMAQVAFELLNRNGGIGGLMDMFNKGGQADAVKSWVGSGDNASISPDAISSVFGEGMLSEVAAKFGLDPSDLTSQLAEHLPGVVDKMTPDGEINANSESGDLLSSVLGMLK